MMDYRAKVETALYYDTIYYAYRNKLPVYALDNSLCRNPLMRNSVVLMVDYIAVVIHCWPMPSPQEKKACFKRTYEYICTNLEQAKGLIHMYMVSKGGPGLRDRFEYLPYSSEEIDDMIRREAMQKELNEE